MSAIPECVPHDAAARSDGHPCRYCSRPAKDHPVTIDGPDGERIHCLAWQRPLVEQAGADQ